jgi:hypothetical protein
MIHIREYLFCSLIFVNGLYVTCICLAIYVELFSVVICYFNDQGRFVDVHYLASLKLFTAQVVTINQAEYLYCFFSGRVSELSCLIIVYSVLSTKWQQQDFCTWTIIVCRQLFPEALYELFPFDERL